MLLLGAPQLAATTSGAFTDRSTGIFDESALEVVVPCVPRHISTTSSAPSFYCLPM